MPHSSKMAVSSSVADDSTSRKFSKVTVDGSHTSLPGNKTCKSHTAKLFQRVAYHHSRAQAMVCIRSLSVPGKAACCTWGLRRRPTGSVCPEMSHSKCKQKIGTRTGVAAVSVFTPPVILCNSFLILHSLGRWKLRSWHPTPSHVSLLFQNSALPEPRTQASTPRCEHKAYNPATDRAVPVFGR